MIHLQDKVRFLSDPNAYPHHPDAVEAIETHMSWVFLAGDKVYKFKKPVVFTFLDHRSLPARKRNCETEYRDNCILADKTYLGVVALRVDQEGRLHLGGKGRAVEWLVVMKRLDRTQTLQARLARGTVRHTDIEAVADRLIAHYRSPAAQTPNAPHYLEHLSIEHQANISVLMRPQFDLGDGLGPAVLGTLERRLPPRVRKSKRVSRADIS